MAEHLGQAQAVIRGQRVQHERRDIGVRPGGQCGQVERGRVQNGQLVGDALQEFDGALLDRTPVAQAEEGDDRGVLVEGLSRAMEELARVNRRGMAPDRLHERAVSQNIRDAQIETG